MFYAALYHDDKLLYGDAKPLNFVLEAFEIDLTPLDKMEVENLHPTYILYFSDNKAVVQKWIDHKKGQINGK